MQMKHASLDTVDVPVAGAQTAFAPILPGIFWQVYHKTVELIHFPDFYGKEMFRAYFNARIYIWNLAVVHPRLPLDRIRLPNR